MDGDQARGNGRHNQAQVSGAKKPTKERKRPLPSHEVQQGFDIWRDLSVSFISAMASSVDEPSQESLSHCFLIEKSLAGPIRGLPFARSSPLRASERSRAPRGAAGLIPPVLAKGLAMILARQVYTPVSVRAYRRVRRGRLESVCAHVRGLPRRKAR